MGFVVVYSSILWFGVYLIAFVVLIGGNLVPEFMLLACIDCCESFAGGDLLIMYCLVSLC